MRDAPTACRHTVSGTISLRSRGTFHHSLTVLSAIGHQGIFRLSGWSRQIHTGFLGPRATWVSYKQAVQISATGVLPSTPDLSHVLRLSIRFLTRPTAGRLLKCKPTTPHAQPLPGITHIRFGLFRFRSPLLPESLLFSLPEGTEMFHFPSFPPHCLCVQQRVTAPRGLSRPPTSFIGSWYQGIHRAPLKTWPQMLASTVQFSNNDQPPTTPPTKGEFTGAGSEGSLIGRTLRHPTTCPTRPIPHHVPRRSSTSSDQPVVPNSQRSTHEQPAPNIRRCTGL